MEGIITYKPTFSHKQDETQKNIQKSGAPNDSFLSDPLKRYFRLPGEPLKLCWFISGRAIIFLSVRSF